jgi:hypothetical protein
MSDAQATAHVLEFDVALLDPAPARAIIASAFEGLNSCPTRSIS